MSIKGLPYHLNSQNKVYRLQNGNVNNEKTYASDY